MHHTPTQRLHRYVQYVATRFSYLQHTCYGEAWTRVTVVLDDDIWMLLFDSCYDGTQHCWTTDTCHVLQTDLLCAVGNKFLCQIDIVFRIVHLRIGDTHGRLRRHACFFRPLNRWDDVARVIQSAEDTGDIHALCVLYLIHQLAHIRWHRVHSQCVQTAVQHVGLDTRLVEGLGKGAYCYIGILTIE